MYLQPLYFAKASILVLEDDPELRASLRHCLADEGYRLADPAADADTACAAIDLVIVGVHRRGDSAKPLPEHSAPVIALVDHDAWLGFEFFDAANALGASAVLRRPFPRAALSRLIGAVLSQVAGSVADHTADEAEPAGLSDLLFQLENPNFA